MFGDQSEITALEGLVGKKRDLRAWRPGVEDSKQQLPGEGRRLRTGAEGDSIIPFIVVILVAGLVLPFI